MIDRDLGRHLGNVDRVDGRDRLADIHELGLLDRNLGNTPLEGQVDRRALQIESGFVQLRNRQVQLRVQHTAFDGNEGQAVLQFLHFLLLGEHVLFGLIHGCLADVALGKQGVLAGQILAREVERPLLDIQRAF